MRGLASLRRDYVSQEDLYMAIEREKTSDRVREMVLVYGANGGSDAFPSFWSDPFCWKDFRLDRLRKFVPRFLFAFLLFLFGMYVNNVSQAWLQQNMAGYYEANWPPNRTLVNHTVRLWDVSFYALPYLNETTTANLFAGAAPVGVLLRFIAIPGPMSLRWEIAYRIAVIWGLLWFCRGITILSTPLPNPDYTCKPKVSFPDNIWLEGLAIMPFVPWYDESTCQDVLYSGHTVALTLNMLVVFKYSPLAPWTTWVASQHCCSVMSFLNVAGVILLLFGYYSIVASHFHYTVDVLFGAMMTFLVFQAYHWAIRVCWIRTSNRYSLYPLLRWLERDAKDMQLWRERARHSMEGISGGAAFHRTQQTSETEGTSSDSDRETGRGTEL
eukprot:TRINITY_DN18509_c0_g1_i1.p1 TRINITY_DN18509_c0_g1~~TRINITY_DN18509_c0_g1_i1.p1  ORF type:complete len:384 (+),score=39.61 TRINITY_DN18509_c0_g1_i1:151-1302(+)